MNEHITISIIRSSVFKGTGGSGGSHRCVCGRIFVVLVSVERGLKHFILEQFQAILPRNCTMVAFSFHNLHIFISNPFGHLGCTCYDGTAGMLAHISLPTACHFQEVMLYFGLSHFSYHV